MMTRDYWQGLGINKYGHLIKAFSYLISVGTETRIYKMVYSILCYFDSWSIGIGSRNNRSSTYGGRSSNSSMGLVHWINYGNVYCKLWYENESMELLCLTLLVAELVSAYPTAGGMYFVTKHVVPPEHVAIWAWVIGWCNFLGQAGGVASLAYTIAQMVSAAAVMNSEIVDGVSPINM